MTKRKCGCEYATAKNTSAVRHGYEMGGYLLHACEQHMTTQPAPLLTAEMLDDVDGLSQLLDPCEESNGELQRALQALADGRTLCVSAPGGPREPDNDMVICPNCTHQFQAIPVNVQQHLSVRVLTEDECRAAYRKWAGDADTLYGERAWLACARANGLVKP